jgi:hypothetical protein
MDRRSVLIKLETALATLGDVKTDVLFENDDVVKVELVSNIFKDIILTKRIDMVSNAILDISTTDLIDYNISIVALTKNEVNLGLKENGNSNVIVSNGEGFAAHPPLN